MVVWRNTEGQILVASFLPPPTKKQALISFVRYVDEAVNFGCMAPQDWLPTSQDKYLSLTCTTNETITSEGRYQI